MTVDDNSPINSLASASADESKDILFGGKSFWFLFPLKYTADYKLSFYHIDQTPSTNDSALTLPMPELQEIKVVWADSQTAGRGQGQNKWESEPGKNLTFSLLCQAQFLKPIHQFLILQAAALAVRHVLKKLCDKVTIKWPNDIYIGDKKVSGTLIQTDICNNEIRRAVIGIGVNVNQTVFTSDAPNPVSLANVLNREINRKELLHKFAERFAMEYESLHYDRDCIRARYFEHLYRKEGIHAYRDAHGTFNAEIVRVEDCGHLVLRDTQGKLREYAFKEVEFI